MSTIKRIKPVSRGRKIEGEIRRQLRGVVAVRAEIPELEGGWTPRLDLFERSAEVIVEMEAPGLAPGDILIALHPNRLTVKGTKGEDAPSGKYKCLRLEREYGAFRRTLFLPATVVPDESRAFLENGLLRIVMPKPRGRSEQDR